MTDPTDKPSRRDIERLEIELRVEADDLDPERITRMLGVNPTIAARKPNQSLTPSTKKSSATSAQARLVRRKTASVAPQTAIGGMSSQDFNAP